MKKEKKQMSEPVYCYGKESKEVYTLEQLKKRKQELWRDY